MKGETLLRRLLLGHPVNQDDQRGYNSTHRSLSELLITDTELKLIAAAAIIGDNSMPKNGYSTPAAIGTPAALYTKAKNRFCRILRMVARLKRLALTIPRKSPLTSAMPALSRRGEPRIVLRL